tara:strand:- start:140 stop:283 length:144 start_codon:yes stop_codon:yes gene_type:complete
MIYDLSWEMKKKKKFLKNRGYRKQIANRVSWEQENWKSQKNYCMKIP